jgi:hypothetical protein
MRVGVLYNDHDIWHPRLMKGFAFPLRVSCLLMELSPCREGHNDLRYQVDERSSSTGPRHRTETSKA